MARMAGRELKSPGATSLRVFGAALASAVTCFAALMFGGASTAGPPPSELDALRTSATASGFALAIEPRKFEFPRDHGPHPEFRYEWWYVTGNLDSSNGERFGFELTFFRIALAPPAQAGGAVGSGDAVGSGGAVGGRGDAGRESGGSVGGRGDVGRESGGSVGGRGTRASESGGSVGGRGTRASESGGVSAWRTRQLFMAHFAITDVACGRFRFAEKFSRDALGLAGAQAQPFRVWLDDWVLGESAEGWALHAQGRGYELTLDAQPLLEPVLNGEQGLARKADDVGTASYYYSIPRVAVHGKLARAGVVSEVRGLAWLDREWASRWLGENQPGWDWFALQLQDGSALMFYAIRSRDGTRDPHSAGTWVDPNGQAQRLRTDQVIIDVHDHWVSPGGARYPSRWRVRVPSLGLDLEARPVLADQELLTKPRYWEGAVDVRGTRSGRDTSGRGYVELVGYGE